jgi:hypothetical protein
MIVYIIVYYDIDFVQLSSIWQWFCVISHDDDISKCRHEHV